MFEMEEVRLLDQGGPEGHRQRGHRPQDRRARPAHDHGGRSLETMFELPGIKGVVEVVIRPEVVEGARPLRIYSDRAGESARPPDPCRGERRVRGWHPECPH